MRSEHEQPLGDEATARVRPDEGGDGRSAHAGPVSEELKALIGLTAGRLRMVQADFAADSHAVQNDYLGEELTRVLSHVAPSDRVPFLLGLREYFPVLASSRPRTEVAAGSAEEPDPACLSDPAFLAKRLVSLFGALAQADRLALVRVLEEGGITVSGRPPGVPEWPAWFRKKYGFDGDESLDFDRAAAMLANLLDFVLALEPVIGGTWTKLSPRGKVRPAEKLRDGLKSCLRGDQAVSDERVAAELQHLRQMIVALITALGQVGGQFARQFVTAYAPGEISALVQMEGGGFWVSHGVKCWRKYQQLFLENMTTDALDTQIRKILTEYAEPLMLHKKV